MYTIQNLLPRALAILILSLSMLHAQAAERHFATPEEAVAALQSALEQPDDGALLALFGDEAQALFDSGDPVADQRVRERFLAALKAGRKLDETGPGTRVLEVGEDGWPFPIPLKNAFGQWAFDTPAGAEELINRRIGFNELYTIQVSLALVDAQREYYQRNPDNAKLLHYARRIVSSAGKRDGLYWSDTVRAPDGKPSPLGALVADAFREGYRKRGDAPAPYHGYYYRLLTRQGPAAEGGAYDYLAKGYLLGGFAVIAWPADYGVSGIKTFIVSHDGVVFERDLGERTDEIAPTISAFNPDEGWSQADDTLH
ncbi:DUF2950 domain-containing protein [Chitinolyticbacter albus]|uniref:DUF2950 domain-containing protein n=1 Tax=Chitinolyticbacter albus TaxID=2961951 RepID=UPI00210A7C99|nr:DUF2950 domain-containing protein [Chitinolyticbacter albus]